jgi:hypothetical protein
VDKWLRLVLLNDIHEPLAFIKLLLEMGTKPEPELVSFHFLFDGDKCLLHFSMGDSYLFELFPEDIIA